MDLSRSVPNRRPRRWLSMAVAAVVASLTAPAHAALIVNVGSVTASPGSTGDSFDVTLTNTGTSAVNNVGAFAFGISVPGSAITFTGVTVNTTSPYIFAGSSLAGPNITDVIGTSPPSVSAEDLTTNLAGITLNANSTVGLGHVLFNVGLGASPGPITVSVIGPPITTLSDTSLGNISLATPFNTGTITVSGASVPAPSSLLMGLIAAAALVAFRSIWKARGRWSLPSPAAPSV